MLNSFKKNSPIGPLEACAATVAIAGGLGILLLYVSYIINATM